MFDYESVYGMNVQVMYFLTDSNFFPCTQSFQSLNPDKYLLTDRSRQLGFNRDPQGPQFLNRARETEGRNRDRNDRDRSRETFDSLVAARLIQESDMK